MIRDLTISNRNVKHLESSDAAVSQFLIRYPGSLAGGRSRLIHHAISGEALWEVTSEGLDMAAARQFAIEKVPPALRAMTFIERAAMLKAVAKHLLSEKERFYALSAQTGSNAGRQLG